MVLSIAVDPVDLKIFAGTRGGGIFYHEALVITSNENPYTLPFDQISIGTNFPNPFANATSFKYFLKKSGNISAVVYDLLGRQMASILSDTFQKSGTHELLIDG